MKVAKYIDDRIKSMLNNPHSTQGYPKTAQGNPCTLEDPSITPIGEIMVYGNSVQNVTPTPENPVEIQSVGDLVTDENDENYGKYRVPLKVRGKNLCPIKTSGKNSAYGITLNYNADGSIHVNSGTSTNTVVYNFMPSTYGSKRFKLNLNGTLTISMPGGVNNKIFLVLGRYRDGNVVYVDTRIGSAKMNIVETDEFVVYIQIAKQVTLPETTLYPQIELNSTATPWEPYFTPQTVNLYLNEPLRKAGENADYIDWENQEIVKNTMDIVLKGTEDWVYSTTYSEFRIPINKLGAQSRLAAICNCYTTNLERGTNNNVIVGMSNQYIFIGDNRFNTAEGFNNWLKSKYDVGDPVIITVGKQNYSSVPIDLPKLPVQPHFTNIISVDTATKGDLTVKYHSFTKEE